MFGVIYDVEIKTNEFHFNHRTDSKCFHGCRDSTSANKAFEREKSKGDFTGDAYCTHHRVVMLDRLWFDDRRLDPCGSELFFVGGDGLDYCVFD